MRTDLINIYTTLALVNDDDKRTSQVNVSSSTMSVVLWELNDAMRMEWNSCADSLFDLVYIVIFSVTCMR